jgi:hypothetical protein
MPPTSLGTSGHNNVLKAPCPEYGSTWKGRADILTRHLDGYCSIVKKGEEELRRKEKENLRRMRGMEGLEQNRDRDKDGGRRMRVRERAQHDVIRSVASKDHLAL